MTTLDTPISLHFKNGNNFPGNFVIMGYVGLASSVVLIATGSYVVGAILLLSLFPITNRHHVVIDPQKGIIHDYTQSFGFIKIGKKYPLKKFKYVTAMPLIQSHNLHASTANSHIVTESSFTATLFSDRLRGKLIVTKLGSKNEGQDVAQQIANILGLTYFEYDPQLVRSVLRGETTI